MNEIEDVGIVRRLRTATAEFSLPLRKTTGPCLSPGERAAGSVPPALRDPEAIVVSPHVDRLRGRQDHARHV